MFAEYFAQKSDLMVWPLVALGIFLVVFLVVLVRVAAGFRKGATMDHVARLPLESDAPHGAPERRVRDAGA